MQFGKGTVLASCPYSRDSWGWTPINNLAMIYAWAGDKESALKQLEASVNVPSGISYGELKLNPVWDPLRGDPRFEKIVASLAPKDAASPTK